MKERRKSFLYTLVAGLSAAVLLAACGPLSALRPSTQVPLQTQPAGTAPVPATGNNKGPAVAVTDQEYDGTTVVVADVVSVGPGWMVIHNQTDGVLGPPIGFTPVHDGDNKNVTVKIDPNQATPVMYAMLHTDAGKVGVYEFPGPDVPVMVSGEMVSPSFKATKHAAGSSTTAAVIVKDQVVTNGKVTIAEVDSPGPGWIAIHVQGTDNQPGKDIGFTAVKAGKNTNVVVTVDPARVTPVMYAMLHTDAGQVGVYEFPGPDAPVEVNGSMVAPLFSTDGTPSAPSGATAMPMGTEPPGEYTTPGVTGMEGTSSPEPSQPEVTPSAPEMAMQTPSGGPSPLVMVSDQTVTDGMVKVDEVVSNGPGWIVIYTTTASGQPDQPIGHAAVSSGDNRDVMVPVDVTKAQGKLYAQLHVDSGTVGTFEYPGPDAPLMIGIQMISGAFSVNQGEAAAPTETPSGITPSIKTADQPIVNATVTIPEVVSDGDAWVVVHRQNGDGTMGGMVGYALVHNGVNTNVVVKVDTNLTSTTMYAMLHQDLGVKGRIEYPGPDIPVEVGGQMLAVPFVITSGNTGDVIVNLSSDTGITRHLVDGHGMSLYISLKDIPGQSNCTGDCQKTWKPLLATGRVIAGSGVASTRLGVILLPDGSRQITYSAAPLYTYTGDTNPGDTNGQGLDGSWFLVTP